MYFDINLKLISGKNTQKVNKQNIRDSQNCVCDLTMKLTTGIRISKNFFLQPMRLKAFSVLLFFVQRFPLFDFAKVLLLRRMMQISHVAF